MSYHTNGTYALFEWRGEFDVHPKYRNGNTVFARLLYSKSPWVTKPQIQQFVDMLAAMKFVSGNRRALLTLRDDVQQRAAGVAGEVLLP